MHCCSCWPGPHLLLLCLIPELETMLLVSRRRYAKLVPFLGWHVVGQQLLLHFAWAPLRARKSDISFAKAMQHTAMTTVSAQVLLRKPETGPGIQLAWAGPGTELAGAMAAAPRHKARMQQMNVMKRVQDVVATGPLRRKNKRFFSAEESGPHIVVFLFVESFCLRKVVFSLSRSGNESRVGRSLNSAARCGRMCHFVT